MTNLIFNLNYRDPNTGLLTSNPVETIGTTILSADWSDGQVVPQPHLSNGIGWDITVGGTSIAEVINGVFRVTNTNTISGNDVTLGFHHPLMQKEVYIEHKVRFPNSGLGSRHAMKHLKLHGIQDAGYANVTYGLDELGAATHVSFGDGVDAANDTGFIINYNGLNKELAGRNYTNGIGILETPQNKKFTDADWGTDWHVFRTHHRFNDGTTTGNEVPNGIMFQSIDGVVYLNSRNLFNRNPTNKDIEYGSFIDIAQGTDNGSNGYVIEFDYIKIAIGGWPA